MAMDFAILGGIIGFFVGLEIRRIQQFLKQEKKDIEKGKKVKCANCGAVFKPMELKDHVC